MAPLSVIEFRYDNGAVQVRGTSEQLGDQLWHCTVKPASQDLPRESFTVEETYPFTAATEALDRYKRKHNLNPTTTWTL